MIAGLVTIHNSGNYGANLQAFATQMVLSRWCDCWVINYQNRYMMKGLDTVRFGASKLYMYLAIHDILHYKRRKKKISRFENFQAKHLNLTQPVTEQELLAGVCSNFELYISGSDQIWNPNVTNHRVDPIYFLEMAPQNARHISYASSLGGFDFSDQENAERIREYLKKYQCVSVRESSSAKMLSSQFGIQAATVLDPTLLLTAQEWKDTLQTKAVSKDYILVYALRTQKKLIQCALQLGKRFGLKVHVIGETMFPVRGVKVLDTIGPCEFVQEISNAAFLLTNSFHGVAFASNFKIPFLSIGNSASVNRVNDYLRSINMLNRQVTLEQAQDLKDLSCDFEEADQLLAQLRENSLEYLKQAIG